MGHNPTFEYVRASRPAFLTDGLEAGADRAVVKEELACPHDWVSL